jgi:hypothetical protein
MLTLCHLDSPVSIRQPESPHLKPFTFFVGRAQQRQGGYQLFLHMGYFGTLAEAQKWQQLVRGRYPTAVAQLAPEEFLRTPKADAPGPQPSRNQLLTDTQVMNILETRAAGPLQGNAADDAQVQIPLVRPEDTGVRRALKQSVAEGAPVSFAVQLHWSTEPIELQHVQHLPVFKGYILYVARTRRDERSRYFLRLGFFTDAVAARQLAFQVRAKFVSAAVVPVTEQEIAQAREPQLAVGAREVERKSVRRLLVAGRKPPTVGVPKSVTERRRSAKTGKQTLNESLASLAEREMWEDPDSTSESGVRHLKVVIQERKFER